MGRIWADWANREGLGEAAHHEPWPRSVEEAWQGGSGGLGRSAERRRGPGLTAACGAHVAHAANALGRAVPSRRRSRAPARRPWTVAARKLAGFGGDRREWTDPGVGAPDLVLGEVDAPHMAGGEVEQHGGSGVPAVSEKG